MGVPVSLVLVVGMYRVDASVPLWSDAPDYANAAAMIQDWLVSGGLGLVSGEIVHPYQFAQENYRQYPAFGLP